MYICVYIYIYIIHTDAHEHVHVYRDCREREHEILRDGEPQIARHAYAVLVHPAAPAQAGVCIGQNLWSAENPCQRPECLHLNTTATDRHTLKM